MKQKIKRYLDEEEFLDRGEEATEGFLARQISDFDSWIDNITSKHMDGLISSKDYHSQMAKKIGNSCIYDILKSRMRGYVEWSLEQIAELSGLQDSQQIIDFGCGTCLETAFLAEHFNKSEFIGIDSSKEMIKRAEERIKRRTIRNLKLIEGNSYELDINKNASLAICAHTLSEDCCFNEEIHYTLEKSSRIKRIKRFLIKSGKLLIVEPCNNDYIPQDIERGVGLLYFAGFNNISYKVYSEKSTPFAEILLYGESDGEIEK